MLGRQNGKRATIIAPLNLDLLTATSWRLVSVTPITGGLRLGLQSRDLYYRMTHEVSAGSDDARIISGLTPGPGTVIFWATEPATKQVRVMVAQHNA